MENIILVVVLVGALFFAAKYVRRIFSGKGSCCSDSEANCPAKDRECDRP